MTFDENVVKGQSGHDLVHPKIHRHLNRMNLVEAGSDVEAAFSKSQVWLAPGTHEAGDLIIDHDIEINAMPGATLECNSLTIAKANSILNARISGLSIRANRSDDAGVVLGGCAAHLQDVHLLNIAGNGLRISGCLNSHFDRVKAESIGGIACDISGLTNTSLLFSACYFRRGSVGVKIDTAITDATFMQCVFEDVQQGLVADNIGILSLYNPYFEAVCKEQIVLGANGQVTSVIITNPIMLGHANNDDTVDAVVSDNVRNLTWIGGRCIAPKIALIRTSTNTENVFMVEPHHLGFEKVFGNPSRAVVFLRDGYMNISHMRSAQWDVFQSYTFEPNDLAISRQGKVAFHAKPDGGVRLAGVNDNGLGLKRGVEVDEYGFTLTRQSDGTLWRYVVGADGTLTGTLLV